MKLLVFSVRKTNVQAINSDVYLLEVKLLLRGGVKVWDDPVDDTPDSQEGIVADYLVANDIPYSNIWDAGDHEWIVMVDDRKIRWADFYTVDEIAADDKDTLCWKTIYLYLAPDGTDFLGMNVSYFDDNDVNKLLKDAIHKIYNQYIKSG
jgi:hypothetical protein